MDQERVLTVDAWMPEAGLDETVPTGRCTHAVKRMIDLSLSAGAVVALSPLFLVIAVLIKLDSPGPVAFRQERIGRQGKSFTMWKFRTMRLGADSEVHRQAVERAVNHPRSALPDGEQVYKTMVDPRITRVGKFLRTWNLDELPQLLNILRGDMSLVGPRPSLDYELPFYKDWYFRRFMLRPGLTGLWQVKRREAEDYDGMMRMDTEYVQSVSLWLDLRIIAWTIPALIRDRGVF